MLDIASLLGEDEVSVSVLQVRLGGVLVLLRIHRFPVVILQPVVLLQCLGQRHDLQTFLFLDGAVADLVVDEHDGTGTACLICDDTDVLHDLFGLLVHGVEVVDLRLGIVIDVGIQIDVPAVCGLLVECFLH